MSANFGGENSSVYSMVRPMTSMRSRSAYMLVYLKSSCLDVLMDTENMNVSAGGSRAMPDADRRSPRMSWRARAR
eukprot:742044-Hanusia_phi.AAC.2